MSERILRFWPKTIQIPGKYGAYNEEILRFWPKIIENYRNYKGKRRIRMDGSNAPRKKGKRDPTQHEGRGGIGSNATNSADATFYMLRKPVDFCTPFSCQKCLIVFLKNICLWESHTSGKSSDNRSTF